MCLYIFWHRYPAVPIYHRTPNVHHSHQSLPFIIANNNINSANEDKPDGGRMQTHSLFMNHINAQIHPSVAAMIVDIERRRRAEQQTKPNRNDAPSPASSSNHVPLSKSASTNATKVMIKRADKCIVLKQFIDANLHARNGA